MPFKARKAVFEKLEEIADVAALSPEDRDKYDQSLKVYNDYIATIESAEQNGMEKGIEKGATTQNLENARKMKALGLETSIIANVTGLSTEDIEQL